MEATIGEEYRRALDYDRLSVDVNQYKLTQAVTSPHPLPEELLDALGDLVEALDYAGDAQNPTDELVKAKSAYFCARHAILMMDKHGFRRSAIVGGIENRLYKVITDLDPGLLPGGPAPSPS